MSGIQLGVFSVGDITPDPTTGRTPTQLDPPVVGGFLDGVGLFYADDVLHDRPIRVRFRWSVLDRAAPYWEQAFSADGGDTWETNWHMAFTRA